MQGIAAVSLQVSPLNDEKKVTYVVVVGIFF